MNKWLYSFLVVVTTSLMGSSFTIGKIGLNYTTPLMLVALRFLLAGILMALITKALKIKHPTKLSDWMKIALIGFFQTACVMGFIFISLRTIPSGQTSTLTFMNPLFVVIFGTLFMKITYHRRQWFGVALGFSGVMITLGAQIHLKIGIVYGFLSAIAWAIGTLLIKHWGTSLNTWVLTAYQMLCGGVILFISSFIIETPHFKVTATSISILLWLGIMASIVQFAIWFYLLEIGDAGKTSAFLFLAPFFGVLTGWLLLDELMNWYVILGGTCIFIGIFMVNWIPQKKIGKSYTS